MLAEAGDRVVLKKAHPCGGLEWEVVRAGADFKLRCLTCGRVVLLDHDTLKKRMRRKLDKETVVENETRDTL